MNFIFLIVFTYPTLISADVPKRFIVTSQQPQAPVSTMDKLLATMQRDPPKMFKHSDGSDSIRMRKRMKNVFYLRK